MRALYLTILGREPRADEARMMVREMREGAEGAGNAIWALLNTHEFLFIQ